MSLAPWRSPLARALHRNRSLAYARYLQLATVQPNGRPANRTVVFRGFKEESNQLQFVIDRRSQKIEQIHYSPWAEACWYFPQTREQFRLLGKLTLVTQDRTQDVTQDNIQDDIETDLSKARHELWSNLSDAARLQFAWPHPGQARASDEAFSPAPPDPLHPLPDFCLLLLNPIEVDHLELRGNPQNRYRYTQNDAQEWAVQAVNP